MTIGKRVYDMMRLRTTTIDELSKQSGVPRIEIKKILNNTQKVLKMKTLRDLSQSLRCTPGWLLNK